MPASLDKTPLSATEAPATLSNQPIPILDLKRQYASLQSELEATVLDVMASGGYVLGPRVERFEQAVADYLGARHAIGVANGSDALFLALKALGIGPGDEVITTCMSYIATSEAIVRTGATPVFVDIEADTFNIDLSKLELAITSNTKALLPVHLFGQALDMDSLMALAQHHNLKVVEDCAQAIGATWNGKAVGTFGDAGCFSFFPTKNLGAAGDGGLITTNCPELNQTLRMIRVHGAKDRYDHVRDGINSRLDAIQAAILQVKLPYIDNYNQGRLAAAQRYAAGLADVPDVSCPTTKDGASHVFHQYTLRVPADKRDSLRDYLANQQIASMIYYPIPLHRQGTHKKFGYEAGSMPVAEQVAKEVLSLPMFPELTEDETSRVVQAIRAFFNR